MSEHQKRQEARRKDYELIKEIYAHLKQVIIDDETYEQTKKSLQKFKTSKKLRDAGVRFNPGLQRIMNLAQHRIARWERDHPAPEKKPEKTPEIEPDKESKTE
ncbi:MAG: hypothetical protein ACTSPB_02430 [Candidatus Thorarchaeota archaeon]